MLAYLLAITIAIGSFSFYMAAFFVPEIHRRQDFFWSGLGLFYAVVLWFCAGRITGAVLLGQTASVVLLGWLGWHTLELRRELTPESVRTPVAWDDLQHWMQTARQKLTEYAQPGSFLSGIQAVWTDAGNAIANLKNRTAGPRGREPSSDVPPLKRSPAYEFETEAGEGESVPSEFATVPMRSQPQVETPIPKSSESTAKPEPTAPSPEKPPASAKATPSPAARTTAKPTAHQETANPDTQPTATPVAKQRPVRSAAAPTQSPPLTPKVPARPNPVTGLALWVSDVVKGFRKPKPPRSVIEIPPRPPSIPRSPADGKPAVATPDRSAAVSKPRDETAIAETDTNWVDFGDEPDSPAQSAPAPSVKEEAAAVELEANQDEPDSTAPDNSSPIPSAPVEAEPETNWPDDDEDTNWPD